MKATLVRDRFVKPMSFLVQEKNFTGTVIHSIEYSYTYNLTTVFLNVCLLFVEIYVAKKIGPIYIYKPFSNWVNAIH